MSESFRWVTSGGLMVLLTAVAVAQDDTNPAVAEAMPGVETARSVTPTDKKPSCDFNLSGWLDTRYDAQWAASGIEPQLCDDATYLRRVSLDLVGRIPSVAMTRDFLADGSPHKRAQLVDRLIADPEVSGQNNVLHAEHLAAVWRRVLIPPGNGDPEVVSVKCCDALIKGNTFRNCHGSLCLRHGNRNQVTGNTFVCTNKKEGVGGLRIYGCDHIVTGNTFDQLTGKGDEAPLVLANGETDTGPLNARFRPQRVTIAGNTLTDCVYSSIDVGYDDGGKLKLPSLDCVISDNTITSASGILINIINPSPTLEWKNNAITPREKAKPGEGLE